jgi:hypothetical protein
MRETWDNPQGKRQAVVARRKADPTISGAAIGRELNISRERVRQILQQHNLRTSARGEGTGEEEVRCKRCGYKFDPRVPHPEGCPSCASRNWDTGGCDITRPLAYLRDRLPRSVYPESDNLDAFRTARLTVNEAAFLLNLRPKIVRRCLQKGSWSGEVKAGRRFLHLRVSYDPELKELQGMTRDSYGRPDTITVLEAAQALRVSVAAVVSSLLSGTLVGSKGQDRWTVLLDDDALGAMRDVMEAETSVSQKKKLWTWIVVLQYIRMRGREPSEEDRKTIQMLADSRFCQRSNGTNGDDEFAIQLWKLLASKETAGA